MNEASSNSAEIKDDRTRTEKVEPDATKAMENSSSRSSSSSSSLKKVIYVHSKFRKAIYKWSAANLGWVEQNWTWSKLKPVIRCSVVGWVSVLLFIIPSVDAFLGQAGFLILIAAFLSPPSDSFLSVLERELLILFFVCLGWAWVSLGVFLANLTRRVHDPTATIFQVATGQYVEAAPTVIMAVFIFIGTSIFLYIKARAGPGPYLFAAVFGCICIDISLTTAVLFPYPFYNVGKSIFVPLAFHSALALTASVLVFPSSVSALFTTRLGGVLSPLQSVLTMHEQLLSTSLSDSESAFPSLLASVRATTKAAEGGLAPLAAAARLIKSDLIYSRFSPGDFTKFQQLCRRLVGRADGLGIYWFLVDPNRETFTGTAIAEFDAGMAHGMASGPSVPPTPRGRRSRSRAETTDPPGAINDDDDGSVAPSTPTSPTAIGRGLSSSVSHQSGPGAQTPTRSHAHSHSHLVSLTQIFTHSHSNPNSHKNVHDILHSLPGSRQSSRTPSLARTPKDRRRKKEEAVGIFESQRYLNLEHTKLHDPDEEGYLELWGGLLRDCCTPVLQSTNLGLSTATNWLKNVRRGRFVHIRDQVLQAILPASIGKRAKAREEKRKTEYDDKIEEIKKVRKEVDAVLENFREEARYMILEPYRAAFEYVEPEELEEIAENDAEKARLAKPEIPPHRYLFNCYVYQYHLIQFASIVREMLDEIINLEEERSWPQSRLWTPAEKWYGLAFGWNRHLIPEDVEEDGDEDPNIIRGLQHDSDDSASQTDSPSSRYVFEDPYDLNLPTPRRRDPDVLPPRNLVERVAGTVYRALVSLGSGNVVFALKAGIFTVLLCLPSLFKSSAGFAYQNRFVWAVFMGQLTLARFRGDTTFGLVARIVSTFTGGVIGMVMWYISCGSAKGNPYGLAVVCAVCFPFFFFARLYWPVHPMTNIILFVTVALVIGFSYQDTLVSLPASPGYGWSVAWRRFVLVTVGVSAAFLVSFLPPSTTIRRYQRDLLATTACKIGSIYCAILSFANTKHEPEIQEIISCLLAVRNKLGKSVALRANVGYEFSLRGRWPADRYKKVADFQMQISYSLSHLMSIIEHLEPSWARAFLRRTRFMDTDFQGDILAVFSMIQFSLRTGGPLPQITPCPLLDRFMLQYHGLNVIHKDADEDYGLPRTLTLDTLKDEQYMMFCVGIATAFGIVNRLDRLMIAVKEIVGEQYHIHGIGFHGQQPVRMSVTPSMSINVLSGAVAGQNGLRGRELEQERGDSGGAASREGDNRDEDEAARGRRRGVALGERTNTVHFHPPTGV